MDKSQAHCPNFQAISTQDNLPYVNYVLQQIKIKECVIFMNSPNTYHEALNSLFWTIILYAMKL